MKRQTTEEIIKFLKDNVGPLADNAYGPGYRASVYLTDNTYLPCVIFRNPKIIIELAKRRFDEEKKGKGLFAKASGLGYSDIVKTFVTKGNCVNDYDIMRVEKSKYVLPTAIASQIRGETTMGWTGFAAKMKDGKYFSFGTSFHFEFFDMPDNYSSSDIIEIINHSYTTTSGELKQHKVPFFEEPVDYDKTIIHRERPFFECYIDDL